MLLPLLITGLLSSELTFPLAAKSIFAILLGAPEETAVEGPPDLSLVEQTGDWVTGTYSLEGSSNFDSYLKELGVGFILRQLAQVAQPTVTVDRNCSATPTPSEAEFCIWTIHTDAAVRQHTISFHLGEEVEDTTMDGRSVRSKFSQDVANQLEEEQTGEGKTTLLVRSFYEDRMEVNMRVGQVSASSVFRRTGP